MCRGVNLGAWLIPERDFTDVTALSLCDFTASYNATARDARRPPAEPDLDTAREADLDSETGTVTVADSAMRAHLETWISAAHFDWMASHGVNSVRLPLGWWDVLLPSELPDAGDGKAWAKLAPGPAPALAAIGRVLDWAAERSISVLLDLHGGPGGQNGKDHSGCARKRNSRV